MTSAKHGERGKGEEVNGLPVHARRCYTCGDHGYLHPCDQYTKETLAEIADEAKSILQQIELIEK